MALLCFLQPPAAETDALCAVVIKHARQTVLDEAMAALPPWKQKGMLPVCMNALEGTALSAVGATLSDCETRADTLTDATKQALIKNEDGTEGPEKFAAAEEALLEAVRVAVGSAALDKLKETPLIKIATDIAQDAVPHANRSFDALIPAFELVVAACADAVVADGLNEDTLSAFFLPLAKLLRLPANETAPELEDKMWSGKPHPLSAAAASIEALPSSVVNALGQIPETALRTRGGALAMAALKAAPSPLEEAVDEDVSSGPMSESWQMQAAAWFTSAIEVRTATDFSQSGVGVDSVRLTMLCEPISWVRGRSL